MSPKPAGLAGKMGYENIRVMLKGNPGWEESGRSLVASDGFVAKRNAVIVDLRSPAAAAEGHITRAVNLPLADLQGAQEKFPKKPSMPIILYGEGDEAARAWAMIKEWGYKKVALVAGGLQGWQARGGDLEKGPAASAIRWVRTQV
jgi:rhodanese-related sulfurtransferase